MNTCQLHRRESRIKEDGERGASSVISQYLSILNSPKKICSSLFAVSYRRLEGKIGSQTPIRKSENVENSPKTEKDRLVIESKIQSPAHAFRPRDSKSVG